MLNIAVCDDNPLHLEHILALLHTCDLEIPFRSQGFLTATPLLETVKRKAIGIALLDIELDGDNGIALAKQLREVSPRLEIIFITAHASVYDEEVYFVPHAGFVHKPIQIRYLQNALRVAVKSIGENLPKKIHLVCDRVNRMLLQEDILYFERNRRMTYVHTVKNGVLSTAESLDSILMKLQNPHFLRCHESYVVNWRFVESYRAGLLLLPQQTEIFVSRRYKEAVAQSFSRFAAGVN